MTPTDATWLADLLAHGLIRSSFVPPLPIQVLRDLTRTRTQLAHEVNRHALRIHKVLQDANLKVSAVVSDLLGVSGRAILNAVIAGETDPQRLAACTTGRLHVAQSELVAALTGRITAHHRFLLRLHLGQIDAVQSAIRAVEAQLEEELRPFRGAVDRLTAMPGISTTVARIIVAEVGADVVRFATAGHLVSWAGLCPRLDESAGKRRSTRTRPGTPWLKTALVQAAWGAVRCRDSYFHAQFLRLKSRRGPRKAVVAVAASLLTAAYHVLRNAVPYRDLGADYFLQHHKAQLARRLVQRLRHLGFDVALHAAPA